MQETKQLSSVNVWFLAQLSFSGPQNVITCKMRTIKNTWYSPYFCLGDSVDPMEHIRTHSEPESSTFESDIPLFCQQGIPSDGQEVP